MFSLRWHYRQYWERNLQRTLKREIPEQIEIKIKMYVAIKFLTYCKNFLEEQTLYILHT